MAAASYFSSVKYAKSLEYMVHVFIGVFKQASFQYPMSHTQRK